MIGAMRMDSFEKRLENYSHNELALLVGDREDAGGTDARSVRPAEAGRHHLDGGAVLADLEEGAGVGVPGAVALHVVEVPLRIGLQSSGKLVWSHLDR